MNSPKKNVTLLELRKAAKRVFGQHAHLSEDPDLMKWQWRISCSFPHGSISFRGGKQEVREFLLQLLAQLPTHVEGTQEVRGFTQP